MSALGTILLHLDASPRSARRLVLACDIAALHDARVIALYASAPNALSLPFVMAEGAAEMLSMLQQLDIDYRDSAKALFDRTVSTTTPPIVWQELRNHALVAGFARRAWCSDLMVLGQHDPADPTTVGVPSDFVDSVLIASGRPALVLPYVDIGVTLGQQVLIAWKPTRESARAVSAAIPLLQRARQIHLTLADEAEAPPDSARELEAYLRAHAVRAPIRRHATVSADSAGEGLLSLAAEIGADLLVMGCYGHGRAREFVLGGASRTVLASMTLPVLMAH